MIKAIKIDENKNPILGIDTNKDLLSYLNKFPADRTPEVPIVTQVVGEPIFAPLKDMPSGQVIGVGATTLPTPNGEIEAMVLYVQPI